MNIICATIRELPTGSSLLLMKSLKRQMLVLGDLCNNTNGTPQLIADAPLQSAQHYIYRSQDPISDSFGWHYGTYRNLAGAYADLDRERIGDKSAPESRT